MAEMKSHLAEITGRPADLKIALKESVVNRPSQLYEGGMNSFYYEQST
jgi:hypothetical protein